MIIATEFLIALRCAVCGKMDFHPVSRFSFACNKSLTVNCSCGEPKLTIGKNNRGQYWFKVPCFLCDETHLLYFNIGQLYAEEVSFFYCNETNVELGFFGPEDKVKAISDNYDHNLESLIDELGYDDYFSNPEVMFEVLNCLHDIAEEGFLYCECGNGQIEIDIAPDKVELCCCRCGAEAMVYADDEMDLKRIRGIKKIDLVKNGFKCLDSNAFIKKTGRNSKKSKR